MRTLHVGLRVEDLERSLALLREPRLRGGRHGARDRARQPDDAEAPRRRVRGPRARPRPHPRPRSSPAASATSSSRSRTCTRRWRTWRARGVQAEEPGSPDGSADFWTAWVTDPDGYRIELVQWPDGHPDGMTRVRPGGSGAEPMTGSHPRSARDVVEELFRRQQAGDDTVLDDLVATDMVNHAAGPQGREGLRTILRTIEVDLGPTELEQHHLIGEGDLVVQHVTLHGTHRASTMPLLADVPGHRSSGRVDVHPHLAGRRRDARRALGLSRRHGPARAAPAVVTGDRLTVGVVTPHAAPGPEVELPAMTQGRVTTVVSRTGSPTEIVAGAVADGPTRSRRAARLDRAGRARPRGGRPSGARTLARGRPRLDHHRLRHRPPRGGRPRRTPLAALRRPCRCQLRGRRGGAADARGRAGAAGAPALVRRRVRRARRGVLPQPGVRRRGDQGDRSPRRPGPRGPAARHRLGRAPRRGPGRGGLPRRQRVPCRGSGRGAGAAHGSARPRGQPGAAVGDPGGDGHASGTSPATAGCSEGSTTTT